MGEKMKRILIADDHLVDRKLVKMFLKNKAECDEAANGNEAILSYNFSVQEKNPYDVILMDVEMPVLRGVEVVRRIRDDESKRKIPPAQRVPVIVVSSLSALEVGENREMFDDFVEKPFDQKELLEKIDKVMMKFKKSL